MAGFKEIDQLSRIYLESAARRSTLEGKTEKDPGGPTNGDP